VHPIDRRADLVARVDLIGQLDQLLIGLRILNHELRFSVDGQKFRRSRLAKAIKKGGVVPQEVA
jgi:hypothetical protein